MRAVSDLSCAELACIVTAMQQTLYLDFNSTQTQVWNPDKEWEGAEVCDRLAALLAQYDLVPVTVTAVADGALSNTVSPEASGHDPDPRPTSPNKEVRPRR